MLPPRTFLLLLCLVAGSRARREIIADDMFKFEFELFNDNKNIRFWLTANFTGWAGIGIGPHQNMTDADLFIGGFDARAEEGSREYGGDYFSTTNGRPTLDTSQDWTLEAAAEVGRQTTVQASRSLVTGDTAQDIDIANTTMNVLWAMGAGDNLDSHGGAMGSISINLVWDGEEPPETTTTETTTTDGSTGSGDTTTTESTTTYGSTGSDETTTETTSEPTTIPPTEDTSTTETTDQPPTNGTTTDQPTTTEEPSNGPTSRTTTEGKSATFIPEVLLVVLSSLAVFVRNF